MVEIRDEQKPGWYCTVRRKCPECDGRKRLTRDEYQRYLAG